jgi:tRNA(fMet)-specific endonuclease VapC
MLYMLDTSTVSHLLRGQSPIDKHMAKLDLRVWCISAVTRSELQYGLALRPEATKLALVVEGFLQMARTLAWDEDAADQHGAVRADLSQRGKRIGDFDEMIAAHALAVGAVLVTDNLKHFKRVPGLRLVNWLRT